jgi:hypothetical protein
LNVTIEFAWASYESLPNRFGRSVPPQLAPEFWLTFWPELTIAIANQDCATAKEPVGLLCRS